MTTYGSENVRCAVCGTESEQLRLLSTNSFGWPDLDLRPPEMRRSTMRAWLQDCPSCGFVAAVLAEVGDTEKSAITGPVAEPMWEEMLAKRGGSDALANRFERRAFIDWQMNKQGVAGFRMLCAAWDADDREDVEHAVGYRTQAAVFFEAALVNTPDAKEATDWTVQLVDVLRRLGKWSEAAAYCDQLIGHALPKVDAIGRFQARAIEEGDNARFTMAIAMEEA